MTADNILATGAMLDQAATTALLNLYQPVDPVANYYKQQILQHVANTPYFANRHFYAPGHLTAQGVVYRPATKSVAMMRHIKLNMDLFFGGHVEPGDHDLIDTARREIAEEGGLTEVTLAYPYPIDLDIHGFPARGDQPDHLHMDARFLFEVGANAMLVQNEESDGVFWVAVSDLRSCLPMWLSNSRLVKAIEKHAGLQPI